MLDHRQLTHKSTSETQQVFTATAGTHDITVHYPFNSDEILVKVFVDDAYIGAFDIGEITEATDITEATENFLWTTNALHD